MRRYTFFCLITFVILMIAITACRKQEESAVNSFDFDEIIIEYHIRQGEKEEIKITNSTILDEIYKAYVSIDISQNATSEPMGFPRFLVIFQKDDSYVADWSIDSSQITSGSQLGLGNYKITDEGFLYDYISDVFSSAINK
ncbi:hypothetical protein KQI61_19205 [Anaerocolumna aminovalerica]|uniref:hypothetical protein n=1 Tax=Anaerocolumna aminovalerica TaxID=1527 RepID=UPI001C0F2C08|nr:hypothetical protein [Anaerocolumna aminovalerica]MBU5334311.1 hypothetical protein [Anaerocolumna aminovalerica]